jgi:hypothetical protein
VRLPSLLFALLLSTGANCFAEALCVLSPVAMPETWRPFGQVQKSLSDAPWSAEETKDAEDAVATGLNELTGFFSSRPASIRSLRDDAVEPFLDATYSAQNMPALQKSARAEARRILSALVAPYLSRRSDTARCDEFSSLLDLTIYSHALLAQSDKRVEFMVGLTNAAFRACGSLAGAMGYDYRKKLAAEKVSSDDVWDLVMWSITFTDAQLVPHLEVPSEARNLPPVLWDFLTRYALLDARAYPAGASDPRFYSTAYLATHIAYIPTGYGRHPIYIADSPSLYRFLRGNFYAVVEIGELDLVAEFVDLFRQYGCSEENDLQVRDGSRYLLRLFHSAGNHWMAYRAEDEAGQIDDYDLIHKAWTGMSGVRRRVPGPPKPGSYGEIIRRWLPEPGQ